MKIASRVLSPGTIMATNIVVVVLTIFVLATQAGTDANGFQDCTDHFKNRVASFEYSYYPGYWMYPYLNVAPLFAFSNSPVVSIAYSTVDAVKTTKKIQWHLHDCGSGRVCIESRSSGWEDTFIGHELPFTVHDTNLQMGPNENKAFKIWCTSCQPNLGTFTYNQCQIRSVGTSKKVYTNSEGSLRMCSTCGSANWFNWRIESPPTKEYYIEVYNQCNSGATSETVTYETKTSITTSQTNSHTVEAKVTAGLDAGGLLGALGVELGYSYTRANMRQMAQEHTYRTSKVVMPNFRYVVKQLRGEAAYTTMNTPVFVSHEIPC